jgi:hypothetical protein
MICACLQRSERIQSTLQDMLPDCEQYRRRLMDDFPPLPFNGVVSTHDECDDGIHLRRELSGKRWDELSHEVLFHGSIALPLLEPDALVAFLPAWLLRSLETSALDDPIVLEITLYFLCPGSEDEGWDETSINDLIRLFNSAQRDAVAYFLLFVVNRANFGHWKQRAEFGLTWWQPS